MAVFKLSKEIEVFKHAGRLKRSVGVVKRLQMSKFLKRVIRRKRNDSWTVKDQIEMVENDLFWGLV